jgi:hypothetical protein
LANRRGETPDPTFNLLRLEQRIPDDQSSGSLSSLFTGVVQVQQAQRMGQDMLLRTKGLSCLTDSNFTW